MYKLKKLNEYLQIITNKMLQKKLLIAIDGPSASGKGTVAKKLSQHFSLPYLNTGALYRATALRLLQKQISITDFEKNISELTKDIDKDDLENEELFSEKIGEISSIIAKNSKLRLALFYLQRNFIDNSIAKYNGAILDGRDIASVIMPEANYKFFITAKVEVRAERRFKQLTAKNNIVFYDQILMQLKARDDNDKNRKDSPLTIDRNAIIIDNENLDAEETYLAALKNIEQEKIAF